MIRKSTIRLPAAAAFLAIGLVVTSLADAQTTYTWVGGTGGGSWLAPGAGGDANALVYPHITGDVARFVDPAAYIVTVDAAITVGQIQFLGAPPGGAYTIVP